jgi:hypothetical protein
MIFGCLAVWLIQRSWNNIFMEGNGRISSHFYSMLAPRHGKRDFTFFTQTYADHVVGNSCEDVFNKHADPKI